MGVTLTLISNAATSATQDAAFPADEPIGEAGERKAAALGRSLRRVDAALTSPALRARQTAAAMGLDAATAPALADIDLGRWSGHRLDAIGAAHPADVLAWTTDPCAAPHGGESVEALLGRTRGFLRSLSQQDGRVVAVSHAAILRAALVLALRAPAGSFWRIDVAPLSVLRLRAAADAWTLLSFGPS